MLWHRVLSLSNCCAYQHDIFVKLLLKNETVHLTVYQQILHKVVAVEDGGEPIALHTVVSGDGELCQVF